MVGGSRVWRWVRPTVLPRRVLNLVSSVYVLYVSSAITKKNMYIITCTLVSCTFVGCGR